MSGIEGQQENSFVVSLKVFPTNPQLQMETQNSTVQNGKLLHFDKQII